MFWTNQKLWETPLAGSYTEYDSMNDQYTPKHKVCSHISHPSLFLLAPEAYESQLICNKLW